MEQIRRLELHVIYQCSNACVFCNEAEHMRAFAKHPATMAEIREMLGRYRRQGYEHVTFTGGEPTLFPNIWEAFKYAKELGYRTFVVSNGAAMQMDEFSSKALPYLDEICLSIHGHNQEVHTGHTRNRKSFDRQKKTLENIQAHPKDHFLMINCVVTRINLPHLSGILDFVTSHDKVKHVLFSQLAPMGDAAPRYIELAPRFSEIVERLPELRRAAQKRGVVVRVCGLPVCVFGDLWECADDLYFSPRMTVARTQTMDGVAGWFEEREVRPELSRFYPKACDPCPTKGRCGGVYKRYWEEIEKPELKPFDVEAKLCRS